ncbi:hypothetical protein BaRGS_00033667 [Batillaria attramentaria]|uniref:Uncharacterized protein n=1 Tax=Batillaria attramentaria TaxID=370345 RepID=A0ABD0JJK8_9CAEN
MQYQLVQQGVEKNEYHFCIRNERLLVKNLSLCFVTGTKYADHTDHPSQSALRAVVSSGGGSTAQRVDNGRSCMG